MPPFGSPGPVNFNPFAAVLYLFKEFLVIRKIARRQRILMGTVLSHIFKGKSLLLKPCQAGRKAAVLHIEGSISC
jgi:hypothetical protein